MAYALANAATPAQARLRALCLSAATTIRDECAVTIGGCTAEIEGRPLPTFINPGDNPGDDAGIGLAGCGEPLVQLLSRQATRLVALYEEIDTRSEVQRTVRFPSPTRATVSVPRPTSVGPGHPSLQEEHGRDEALSLLCSAEDASGSSGRRLFRPSADDPSIKKQLDMLFHRLDDLLSIAYTKFYAYMYKDLPMCWRQLYTDAAILKFSCLLLRGPLDLNSGKQIIPSGNLPANQLPFSVAIPTHQAHIGNVSSLISDDELVLDELARTLDLALILAGAAGRARGRRWIDQAFALLEESRGTTTTSVDIASRGSELSATVEPAVLSPKDKPATSIPASDTVQREAKRVKLDRDWGPSFSTHEPFTPPVQQPIRRVVAQEMGLAAFQRHLDQAGADGPEPLVFTGLVDAWPARGHRPWCKPNYLLARTLEGRRLVPVEIGRSYVDEGWGQEIVKFGNFLRDYVDPTLSTAAEASQDDDGGLSSDPVPNPIVYLAQHQLLLQLPQLRNDILIPDQCYTAPPSHPTDPSQDQPELDEPMLHAWLGPPGTITPLHTDPYHNLLVQVVGRKYVRLYAPHQSSRMRPRGTEHGVDMRNTSLLDVGVLEAWDATSSAAAVDNEERSSATEIDTHDQLKGIPFLDCILEPGDSLYIPIGWWHYVRGLSVSFSVSFWWN